MLDRREFVALAVGGVTTACASLVTVPVQPREGNLRLILSEWPNLTRPGGTARLRVGGTDTQIYVLAMDDGTYSAVSPICTHQGCTVEFAPDRLSCPCHGSEYDRTGAVLRGPTRAPLDRFVTRLTADNVLIIELGA